MQPGEPKSGGDYPELPEMTFIKCKVAEDDDAPSIAPNTKFPDEKTGEVKDQLTIILDAISYVDEDGDTIDVEGARIWVYSAVSLHEKANLRPLAVALMPENTTVTVLTAEEKAVEGRAPNLFEDFDTDDMAGKFVWVIGKYKADDTTHSYLKATGFKRYGTKKKPAEAQPAAKAAPAGKPAAAKKVAKAEEIDI
jgi:hypothetical protein